MNNILNLILVIDFWGIGLLLVRFLDGYKYHIESSALRRTKVAYGRSRRFINYAWSADAYMIAYLFIHKRDWYLVVSCIIALGFMTEYWITLYNKYPYRMRGCINFKKPNIIIYLLNSILPNCLRRRL